MINIKILMNLLLKISKQFVEIRINIYLENINYMISYTIREGKMSQIDVIKEYSK